MDKPKLGVGILIVAVLALAGYAGAWYWTQPGLDVKVSGALSTDDVSAITEVVKHHFLGPERIPVFTQFGYTINKFLAKLHGDPGERLVIEMVVRSDGTVGSAAVLCPGRCSYGAEYDLRREADGWGGQPTGSGHCR